MNIDFQTNFDKTSHVCLFFVFYFISFDAKCEQNVMEYEIHLNELNEPQRRKICIDLMICGFKHQFVSKITFEFRRICMHFINFSKY